MRRLSLVSCPVSCRVHHLVSCAVLCHVAHRFVSLRVSVLPFLVFRRAPVTSHVVQRAGTHSNVVELFSSLMEAAVRTSSVCTNAMKQAYSDNFYAYT